MVNNMNKFVLTPLLLLSFYSYAQCIGSDAYSTCYDDNGNTYDVSRYGNTTEVQGRSANGNTWNQTTETYGNQVETRGRASNGAEWSENRTDYGNGNYSVDGTNAQGEQYYYQCNNSGCY